MRIVQDAADRYEVCFLGSDIAADGGKLLLSGAAPRAVGDDEERMLLAMRQVIEAAPRLPVRIGVNRGNAFASDVGPFYRRTYAVMGDTVNLAARLCAKAPWGSIYATPGVLDRSRTRFQCTTLEPFMVKGKSRPVQALEVGAAAGVVSPAAARGRVPLVGRRTEMIVLAQGIASAKRGRGGMIELTGDAGSGKSRLLAEARRTGRGLCRGAHGLRGLHPDRPIRRLARTDPPAARPDARRPRRGRGRTAACSSASARRRNCCHGCRCGDRGWRSSYR